jgi:hypothetical protein
MSFLVVCSLVLFAWYVYHTLNNRPVRQVAEPSATETWPHITRTAKTLKKCPKDQQELEQLANIHHLREKKRNGLVIIVAHFGLLDTSQCNDVTIPIRFLIESNSTVLIPSHVTKSSLIGFGDPYHGKKQLRIIYRYKGDLKLKTIYDDEQLILP